MKEREEKNSGRKKKVRKKKNYLLRFLIFVGILTSVALFLSSGFFAIDITALKEYMQTDECIEKTAREKLGMVKDNEILFKESQSK